MAREAEETERLDRIRATLLHWEIDEEGSPLRSIKRRAKWTDREDWERLSFAASKEADLDVSCRLGTVAPLQPTAHLPRLDLHSVEGVGFEHEFRSLGVLGEGGMGIVELVVQRSLCREVAIKRVRAQAGSAPASQAILREAIVTGSLGHPGIVPVHLLAVDQSSQPLFVMKRVEGRTWHSIIHEHHARPSERREDFLMGQVEILIRICDAVAFAHSRGVLHLDIKPENVMVGAFGEVYLLDWGVAAPVGQSAGGRVAGTPAYMAPEMSGVPEGVLTERTDVYLLGATLHAAVTGRARHDGASLPAVLHAARKSLPFAYDQSIPTELASLLNRATARDPNERFNDAGELRFALVAFVSHRGSHGLARAAIERLETLSSELEALGQERSALEAAASKIHQLYYEARFGFEQALGQWSENREAREGLSRCLERMLEYHLLLENTSSAAAILKELPAPRPDAERRLEKLREFAEHKRRAVQELERVEWAHNITISSRERGAVFAVWGFIVGVGTLAAAELQRLSVFDVTSRMPTVPLFAVVVFVYTIRLRRKHLLKNEINVRLRNAVGCAIAAVCIRRFVGAQLSMSIHVGAVVDLIVLGSFAAAAAALADRSFLWMSFILMAGACLTAFSTVWHLHIAAASAAGSLIVLGLVWMLRATRSTPPTHVRASEPALSHERGET